MAQQQRIDPDCKQFVDPKMGGRTFVRPPLVVRSDGAMSPQAANGARLYEIGMQSRAELEAKVTKMKEDQERVVDWVCTVCAGVNGGLVDTCQNVVKSGRVVRWCWHWMWRAFLCVGWHRCVGLSSCFVSSPMS